MRYRIAVVCNVILLSGAASGAAQAQDGLVEYKKGNTDACMQLGTRAPSSPRDPRQLAPYCHCVSERYWASVPKRDVDVLLSTGRSFEIGKNVVARLHVAMAACKQRMGFD